MNFEEARKFWSELSSYNTMTFEESVILTEMVDFFFAEISRLQGENGKLSAEIEQYKEDECFMPPVTCSDCCRLLRTAEQRVARECLVIMNTFDSIEEVVNEITTIYHLEDQTWRC